MQENPLKELTHFYHETVAKENALREVKSDEKLSLRKLLKDISLFFITLTQRAFFFTAWQLTRRPGKACRKYVEGYRNYLHHPIEYLILVGALAIIFNFRYHFFADTYMGMETRFAAFPEYRNFLVKFFNYTEEYTTIVNIVGIPVFSVVSYTFFVDREYNFAEVLVMNNYVACQQMLFLLLFIPLIELFPNLKTAYFSQAYFFLVIIYNIWAYIQFFGGNTWVALLKSVLSVLLSYALQLPFNLLIYYLGEPYLKYLVF